MSNSLAEAIAQRRTFAIISHPDAGKTTLTEKLLLLGGAIQVAGAVKGRKASRHATSDWMALEQQRGISVTTSVMQFDYQGYRYNLLDTPGHEDFSEDTYRTLTAVDTALMVIDSVKGVESRTIKLMEVCQLRHTPIITFINKMDRDGQEPIVLLDEIESVLKLRCVPMTWPVGRGRSFKGVYDRLKKCLVGFAERNQAIQQKALIFKDLKAPETIAHFGAESLKVLQEELELLEAAGYDFDRQGFEAGQITPVYFGSAMHQFGVTHVLEALALYGHPPLARATTTQPVAPDQNEFTGFVFKIQANMDPMHRDRIAFVRVCSGRYHKGMKIFHTRTLKEMNLSQVHTFMAGERHHIEEAYAGDIIGIHNHGTLQIGDTLTQGQRCQFIGIPYFAPELFKAVRCQDPLKAKALHKGLHQLSEEGATQVFKPIQGHQLILGAVGILQFDVVAYRLQHEYQVACVYDTIPVATARWLQADDPKLLEQLMEKVPQHLAYDAADQLTYLAPSLVNLRLMQERWPQVRFLETREHHVA